MASKYQHTIRNEIIRVVDGGGDQKVSENAEAVCAQLLRTYGKLRIMFLDGTGWHQMVHDGEKLTEVVDLETKNERWAVTNMNNGPRVQEVKKKAASKPKPTKKATAKKAAGKKSGADDKAKAEKPAPAPQPTKETGAGATASVA